MEGDLVRQTQWFVRSHGRRLDLLWKDLLGPGRSSVEVNVLYELAEAGEMTARDLCDVLGVDAGYLSRVLTKLQREDLVRRRRSDQDARQWPVSLTAAGEVVFARRDQRYEGQIRALLLGMSGEDRQRLADAMETIANTLAPDRVRPSVLPYLDEPAD